ncbi:Peptidylprolyl isomerase [Rhodopirellula maiorica SM1]|uniref:peptidylprolyl isomerase n=1 Tax=Rhodopirellula maiorica SM1 TaxID=1265738 RepID=M5RG22_9BACT|nr:peptidylprolyl isomerase [Rhodopirellula maiorica]EMI18091.1 Peptidylprolyl isomerase [Rhodopirellula maiorica SM1]
MIDRVFLFTLSTLGLVAGLSLPAPSVPGAFAQDTSPAATTPDDVPAQDAKAEPPHLHDGAHSHDGEEHSHSHDDNASSPKGPTREPSNLLGKGPDGKPFELNEEGEQAKAKYVQLKEQLVDVLIDMRTVHTLYMNGEDQTPEALQRYRELRAQSYGLFDQVFDAAYEYLLLAPDQEAAQYLLTMLEHRFKHSNYSLSTMRASALLIDLGFNQVFLFQTAARSSVCVGEFETAEKIYEYLKPEDFGDLDKRFSYQMESLKEQWEEEQKRREQDAEKELPRVKLKTTHGDIVIELFLDQAPTTVAHFIKLVEQGYYDGLDFYQVIDDLLALTGDESGTGSGNSGQFIVDEHHREGARNAFRGSLAMAKLPKGDTGEFVADSGSSQFAIFFTPVPTVSKEQTVFGRVIEGMDLFTELRRVDPHKEKKKGQVVYPPDRIIEAEVIRRPDELPEPEYRK